MKRISFIRISGIAIILSLLFMLIPVLPAYAAYTIALSPTTGRIGNTVTVTGVFSPAPTVETWAFVYFSPNNINVNTLIGSASTRKEVAEIQVIDTLTDPVHAGNFTGTFTVPSSLTEGAISQNVTSGTYYVYVTSVTTIESTIKAKAAFTAINPTAILDPLSPASGPAGTVVVISGSNFPASAALVFKFGTTTITPTAGHTSTLSTGLFLSSITIPATATPGPHTITVNAGIGSSAVTASATFTVTASASITLIPDSVAAGAQVTIVGANFLPSVALSFKFDAAAITISSGDVATSSGGLFTTKITIPSTASAGSHSITATAGASSASGTFTVTNVTATLSLLSPTSGPPRHPGNNYRRKFPR